MRATLMYGAGDVRVETVPDARLIAPTDALVRVTRSAICGSDLWPYKSMEPTETGRRTGHEFIGVVEDVGDDVRTMKKGDLVVTPFVWSDGTCFFCRQGLHVSCLHGGSYAYDALREITRAVTPRAVWSGRAKAQATTARASQGRRAAGCARSCGRGQRPIRSCASTARTPVQPLPKRRG